MTSYSSRHVSNASSGEPEVLVRDGAGERLVADGGPQPVQDSAVAGLPVGPGGVALIAQGLGRAGRGLWFGQRVRVRADVADRDVMVTRSGLACWLRSAPSEWTVTSAPGRSAAARLNPNTPDRVPVAGDVAAQAAGRGECQGGDTVPGRELDQLGGVRADLLPGRGRHVRWLGRRLAHVRPSPGHRPAGPRTVSPHHGVN
jgi:hypothetical protein